jgi:hypothetical protein
MIHPTYPFSNEGEEQRAQKGSADNMWGSVQRALPDVREQRLAFLLFNCGLKPREIVSHCPQEFCDVQEVCRLRRNILEQFLHYSL